MNTAMKNFLKIIVILFLSACFIAIIQYCTKPSAPSVTTATVSDITIISAVSGGNVTNNGGEDVTERGVCWGTTQNPTTTSSKASSGKGNGPFTSSLTQLTSNTLYHIRAYATNSVGTAYGNELTFTTTAVISTVPGAPTIGTATAGNAQASVTFTAPVSDGSSAITGYTVTSSPGGLTAPGSASPITITGLTNGTAYTFTVTATNAIGTSLASSASNSVTPSTVPDAPLIGTAIKGNAQATLTFTAPVNNGGSAITGYTVTSSPGNIRATGPVSPITVTGLTNGIAYTFTVTATNANGTGPASSASNSVTPSVTLTVPDAPTIGTATGGNAQASVTFTAPASNGGSAITGYTLTSNPGSFIANGTASPITITGLTNGTAYTFTVTATNAIGTSLASSASNPVTPSTIPGPPTIGTATKGNAQASVTFSSPLSNGGSVITGYIATSNPEGLSGSGISSPITVTGLTNGIAYTFSVAAVNANGTGTSSASSNSVIPSTVPGAPVIGTATPGNAQASVSFTAPASDGGSAITGYTVTSSPGGITRSGSVSPVVVNGLSNGTGYTFTVTATNVNGPGFPSSASNLIIPTPASTVSDVDGNVYNTITIGTQVWMKENLKTTKYSDGSGIPLVTGNAAWAAMTTPAYCWYINDGVNYKNPYGALYNWYVLDAGSNGGKNACPTGWHVATDSEWTILTDFLTNNGFGYGGSGNDIGKSIAATSGWTTSSVAGTVGNSQDTNNSSGFTAYPIGDRSPFDGTFYTISTDGTWWTATSYNTGFAYFRSIKSSSGVFTSSNYNKPSGFAVRCVKN
jgi:uncharacterized protein (TIGR02145 family)